MRKKEKIIGAAAFLVISIIALLVGYFSANKKADEAVFVPLESQVEDTMNIDKKEDVKSSIVVDIKGAIKNPREYTLKEGARVRDLIEIAGGLTEEADENKIYYSKILNDEDCIKIYKIGEETTEEDTEDGKAKSNGINSSGKININKASSEQLQTLPGIGETRANSIIEYREAQGGFKSIEELSEISGIGNKTMEKLRDMVDIK